MCRHPGDRVLSRDILGRNIVVCHDLASTSFRMNWTGIHHSTKCARHNAGSDWLAPANTTPPHSSRMSVRCAVATSTSPKHFE